MADDDGIDLTSMWSDLLSERERLISLRTDLETELIDVRNKISHLDSAVGHLAPLIGIAEAPNKLNGMGITDAVRLVLERARMRLSPQEVREWLATNGFDLSGLTAPMASIYKVLSRLEESKEIEREKEEGRVYYKWKNPVITDEDIPF
jgi:hypothetical protein